MKQIAQVPHPQGNVINGIGFSENVNDPTGVFEKVISSLIGILTVVAGLWLIFTIITGGIAYINAGGDKAAIEEARKKILIGIVGLTIVISALFLTDLIGYIIGFDILNLSDTLINIFT